MCSEPVMRAPFRAVWPRILADGHQAGHLGFSDADFFAAPFGQADVGNDAVGVDGGVDARSWCAPKVFEKPLDAGKMQLTTRKVDERRCLMTPSLTPRRWGTLQRSSESHAFYAPAPGAMFWQSPADHAKAVFPQASSPGDGEIHTVIHAPNRTSPSSTPMRK